ncbi:MAG: hypothetical protein JF593_13660 [Novosphingobium sp.]|nr:hypothetical protein [Novosphingobium sp.]
MELYEIELEKARYILARSGRNADDFRFAMDYLEPDPDGAGMFTVRYEVTITHHPTGKELRLIGGIGLDWVRVFAEALDEGEFDD